jgi:hypothetical protein
MANDFLDDLPRSDRSPDDDERMDLAKLELMIASAGQYVRPTDDLRPRVLEVARERYGVRRTCRHLAGAMCVATLCVLTGVAISDRFQTRVEAAGMPRGERLERLLDAHPTRAREGHVAAWADVLSEWRGQVAARLSGSPTDPARMLSDAEEN